MSIYSIIGLAIICCVLIIMVRQYKPEFALIVTIASGVIILIPLVSRFSSLLGEIKVIAETAGIKSQYIEIMLKGLGISYLTQFSSDVCTDFGQTSLASKIELCGKITLAALSIPLLLALIEIIKKML